MPGTGAHENDAGHGRRSEFSRRSQEGLTLLLPHLQSGSFCGAVDRACDHLRLRHEDRVAAERGAKGTDLFVFQIPRQKIDLSPFFPSQILTLR